MALKIGVISQKGGVGKSTLVRALAVEYARNGFSVKVADMDLRQKTTTDWNCLRMNSQTKPAIAVEPFANVQDALKHEAGYDLIIFDGAGHADSQTLEIAQTADFVILPTGVTRDDLLPQVKLAHELRKKGIEKRRLAFALSRVGASTGEQEAAIEFITEAGYHYGGMIHERTSIGQCHDNGFAANETKYASINNTVDQLIQNLGDRINLIEENTNG